MTRKRGTTLREDDILALLLGDEEKPEVARAVAEAPGARARARELAALRSLLEAQRPEDAIRFDRLSSPLGPLYLAATGAGLARVSWRQPSEGAFIRDLEGRWAGLPVVRDPSYVRGAREQLEAYFGGELDRFDLPVDLSGLPPFQRAVLEAVRSVPFGRVVPYAELARRIRRPKASRAVGNALGANPIAVVVPCHRVVRSDGSLGGYTGGAEIKKHLLALEGRGDLV